MSLLLETIRLENGEYNNLSYHEQRMNRSLKTLCGSEDYFDLERFISYLDKPTQGLYKCRITYDENSQTAEFEPYQPRVVERLKLVEHNYITYEFKFQDRRQLEKLYQLRDGCDDILIVKKGLITDTSYANIVFRRGKQWYTPWDPLLKGTMRQYLLQWDKVIAEEITLKDLTGFETFKLVNAMLKFDSPEMDIKNIIK